MSVLMITSGIYSNAQKRVEQLAAALDCQIITDKMIIAKTADRHKIKQATLQKVVESRQIAFNDFTHETEKCIACLKEAIADEVSAGNRILHGITGHLIPKEVSHVLRVLIITDKQTRIKNGIAALKSAEEGKETGTVDLEAVEKEVKNNMAQADKYAFLWTNTVAQKKAWNKDLYDIVVPTDKVDVSESVSLVLEQVKTLSDIDGETIKQEAADFRLTAEVEIVLASLGKGLFATADKGKVVVTIDKKVLMLSSLQQKVIARAMEIEGVESVETKIGKNYYQTDITHNYNFETPTRILLVDDEKEFVQTLSKRLEMRQFANEIALNGEQALDFTNREKTDVMVLDLRMPGIDGIEVLRQIKESKPDIEVIILTGHGSEADRKKCMELGAFAYLQKPADIDLLTRTMQEAYDKINAKK
ncbi:MAG: response regulator [Desulfobacteraceae bacterium]